MKVSKSLSAVLVTLFLSTTLIACGGRVSNTSMDEASTSVSKESEQADETPSLSEIEACQTVPQLIELALGLRGGQGTVAISEVTEKLSHLIGVQAVLESEEAPMLGSLSEFSMVFNLTYPSLAVSQPPRVSLRERLERLTTATETMGLLCMELDQDMELISLPLSMEDFYPDGFWNESVTEIHLNYGINSDDDLYEVVLENDTPVYLENGAVGSSLILSCDTQNSNFGVILGRHDGNYNPEALGPQGAIDIYISVDGGPEYQQDGYFLAGSLFPYMSRFPGGDIKTQGIRTWNAISSGRDYFTVRVDEPGARFEANFPLRGIESVREGLDSRGCLDF